MLLYAAISFDDTLVFKICGCQHLSTALMVDEAGS